MKTLIRCLVCVILLPWFVFEALCVSIHWAFNDSELTWIELWRHGR